MIPFIRSHKELMVITQPKNQDKESQDKKEYQLYTEDSGQRKRYIRSKHEKEIDLPNIPKNIRRKSTKRKEDISKIFDKFEYNNNIKSTYELKLIQRQKKNDMNNAA